MKMMLVRLMHAVHEYSMTLIFTTKFLVESTRAEMQAISSGILKLVELPDCVCMPIYSGILLFARL